MVHQDTVEELERRAELRRVRAEYRAERASRIAARVIPYLPLVLVNTMAILGQMGWGRHNLTEIGADPDDPIRWAVAALFAATLESLALFLGYYASKALERRDSAAGLYLAAFVVAGVVGAVNYSHYADHNKVIFTIGPVAIPGPTATAITFGLFSLISPWLWRIHSRAVNRDKLYAAGEIDPRGVKLSLARKFWYPIRSLMVMRYAAWAGITNPSEAIALYEQKRAARRAARRNRDQAPVPAHNPTPAPDAAELHAPAPAARAELCDPTPVTPTVLADALAVEREPTPAPAAVDGHDQAHVLDQAPARPRLAPVPRDESLPEVARRFPAAWDAYVASVQAGSPLSQRALAAQYLNGNRHRAREIIQAYQGRAAS